MSENPLYPGTTATQRAELMRRVDILRAQWATDALKSDRVALGDCPHCDVKKGELHLAACVIVTFPD